VSECASYDINKMRAGM